MKVNSVSKVQIFLRCPEGRQLTAMVVNLKRMVKLLPGAAQGSTHRQAALA